MPSRPKVSLPDDLDIDAARAPAGSAEPPPPIHEQVAPKQAAPQPTVSVKQDTVATTLYLMPADHVRVRTMAMHRNVSMQTLVMDAIDLLLKKEKAPLLSRWETRRKVRL